MKNPGFFTYKLGPRCNVVFLCCLLYFNFVCIKSVDLPFKKNIKFLHQTSGRWLWCRCMVLTRRTNIDFFLFLLTSSAHLHTHTRPNRSCVAWCLRRSIVSQQLKGFVYNWESEKKMTATAFSAHGNSSSSTSSCSCWRRVRIHRAMRCWTTRSQ